MTKRLRCEVLHKTYSIVYVHSTRKIAYHVPWITFWISIKLVNNDFLTGALIPNTNFANFIDDLSAPPFNRLTMASFVLLKVRNINCAENLSPLILGRDLYLHVLQRHNYSCLRDRTIHRTTLQRSRTCWGVGNYISTYITCCSPSH